MPITTQANRSTSPISHTRGNLFPWFSLRQAHFQTVRGKGESRKRPPGIRGLPRPHHINAREVEVRDGALVRRRWDLAQEGGRWARAYVAVSVPNR